MVNSRKFLWVSLLLIVIAAYFYMQHDMNQKPIITTIESSEQTPPPSAATVTFSQKVTEGPVDEKWIPELVFSKPLADHETIRWISKSPHIISAHNGLSAVYPGEAIICVEITDKKTVELLEKTIPDDHPEVLMLPEDMMRTLGNHRIVIRELLSNTGRPGCAVFAVIPAI